MIDLLESFNSAIKLRTKTMPLAAIWLEGKVNTSEGIRNRICPGMKVAVKNDVLLPDGDLNYEITECYGTLNNTDFSIDVVDDNGVKSNVKLSLGQ